MNTSEIIFIYVTTKDKEQAVEIGTTLVHSKLAACVNILPQMTSIYQWQGKLEHSEESVMIVKTKRENFELIKDKIREMHTYTCPCILSFGIENGNKEYLDWLEEQTRA